MLSSNTVMLVGSAPQFPHGSMDDIQDIAALGVRCSGSSKSIDSLHWVYIEIWVTYFR